MEFWIFSLTGVTLAQPEAHLKTIINGVPMPFHWTKITHLPLIFIATFSIACESKDEGTKYELPCFTCDSSPQIPEGHYVNFDIEQLRSAVIGEWSGSYNGLLPNERYDEYFEASFAVSATITDLQGAPLFEFPRIADGETTCELDDEAWRHCTYVSVPATGEIIVDGQAHPLEYIGFSSENLNTDEDLQPSTIGDTPGIISAGNIQRTISGSAPLEFDFLLGSDNMLWMPNFALEGQDRSREYVQVGSRVE